MKCPYCDKEMELGYIQSPNPITWGKKKKIFSVPATLGADIILNDDGEFFAGSTVEAYNCPDCKKLIISYDK